MPTDTPAKPEASFVVHPLQPLVRFLEHAEPPKPDPGRVREAPLQFTERGAALFVAHLVLEVGEARVAKMKRDEVLALALRCRAERPHVWPAMRLGDYVRLVHRDKGAEGPRPTVSDLQGMVDKLLAEPPVKFAKPAAAPAA